MTKRAVCIGCRYGTALLVLAMFCGCSPRYYSIAVENHSANKLEDVEIAFPDSDFTFRYGRLSNGSIKGYSPLDPRVIPETVKLTWRQVGEAKEKLVTIPKAVQDRIKGKSETLFLRIGDETVEVYLEIYNPIEPGKPEYYPPEFGKRDSDKDAK